MVSFGGIVETFGPFLIPVVIFVLGVVGYLFLLGLTRALGRGEAVVWYSEEDDDPGDREP